MFFLQLVQLAAFTNILFVRSAKFSSHDLGSLVRSQFSLAILVDTISSNETYNYANCKLIPLVLVQKNKKLQIPCAL